MQPKLTVKMTSTDELVPYAGNAKEHPDWQIEQIAASIEQFGFDDPVGIWHDGQGQPVIVEGHGRVLAAKELGIEKVPTIALDHLDDEGRRAYTLAHNKLTTNTGYDADMLAAELDAIEGIDMADFGFDGVVSIDDFGTDFTLPDSDAPQFKYVSLVLTHEQYDVLCDATESVDRDSVELRGGNVLGDKVCEVMAQWARQRTCNSE